MRRLCSSSPICWIRVASYINPESTKSMTATPLTSFICKCLSVGADMEHSFLDWPIERAWPRAIRQSQLGRSFDPPPPRNSPPLGSILSLLDHLIQRYGVILGLSARPA